VKNPHAEPLDLTLAAPSTGPREERSADSGFTQNRLIAGRYALLGLIGSGGMGSVYRARDTELDELVALKVLRRELVDSAEMLERFRREVKLARRVTHRNVARTFDIGEHEGEKFITMELVAGVPLGTLLAREGGRFSPERAAALLSPICEGLRAAHDAGVVHRDLKPDNVLVDDGGRVVITDFGIARGLGDGDPRKTQGSTVGTPAYMSPEQAEGRTVLDARADLYALGAMLFEMLTGELPWQGDAPFAVVAARLVKPPPDPRSVRPSLGEAVARVVLRCLARRPEERFATATEVAEAFTEAVTRSTGAHTTPTLGPAPSLPSASRTPTAPQNKSIAVLPLQNGGAPDDAYLADSLTEDLIDRLSITPGLRVRPRGTVERYRGDRRDVREVGKELEVDVVVEGSVRRAGPMLRVQTRALSVHDGFQLWAQRFDRPAAELFAVSDEVAAAVAEALTVHLAEGTRHVPPDPVAMDHYLRGRHAYHSFDPVNAMRAAEHLDKAAALAPDDPAILGMRALAWVRLWFFGGESSEERARAATADAVRAAPERGETLAALASMALHEQDFGGAIRLVRRALAAAPALADAHDLLGRILAETGPGELALNHLQTAQRLDPAFLASVWASSRTLALLGRWDEADALLAHAVELDQQPTIWIAVARLASWRGDAEAAARHLAHPQLVAGKSPIASLILGALCGAPLTADPLQLLGAAAGTQNASWRARAFIHQARAELGLGLHRDDFALEEVARSAEEGLIDLLWMDQCPALDHLRTEPRFQAARELVFRRATRVHEALR
jgi:serine/threonine protein kinase/tetratricopeptide (TPR) repeat protein